MTFAGTIYGVVLNDRAERARLNDHFYEKPYAAPPEAPVVYIKPGQCVTRGTVPCVEGAPDLAVAATLALLFGRDATQVSPADARGLIGGVALALDVHLPQDDYYRPAVAQATRDGFLPIGELTGPTFPPVIETLIDGELVHSWSLDRLVRPVDELVANLSGYMTLRAGDLLLIGLAGDAPTAGPGQSIEVRAQGLPTLSTAIEEAVR